MRIMALAIDMKEFYADEDYSIYSLAQLNLKMFILAPDVRNPLTI